MMYNNTIVHFQKERTQEKKNKWNKVNTEMLMRLFFDSRFHLKIPNGKPQLYKIASMFDLSTRGYT